MNRPHPHHGFTLVEVLIAASVAGVLLAALAATATLSLRSVARVDAATDGRQLGVLAAELLRNELELAGRGLDAGGVSWHLDATGAGGDVFTVRYLAEAHRAEAVLIDATFEARTDAAGRPNLYRRPAGGTRQPWLLNVSGLHLLGGVDASGAPVARERVAEHPDLAAVTVRIDLVGAPSVTFRASLARSAAATAPAGTAGNEASGG